MFRTTDVDAAKFCRALALGAGLLALFYLAGVASRWLLGHDHLRGLIPAFDLDGEANVPTWYSTQLLFLVALLAGAIASEQRAAKLPSATGWLGFSLFFLLLSLDEAAGLHEWVDTALRPVLPFSGVMRFVWVVVALPALLLLGLGFQRFLRELPSRTRRRLWLSAAVYFGCALGIEVIGGWLDARQAGSLAYSLEVLIEEIGEMAGAILFLHALLCYRNTEPTSGPRST